MEKEAKQGWSFGIHKIAVNNVKVPHKLREQQQQKNCSLQLKGRWFKYLMPVGMVPSNGTFFFQKTGSNSHLYNKELHIQIILYGPMFF